VTSLGSAIFAFLAAGTFKTIEEAQDKICPPYRTFEPDPSEQRVYDDLYRYFSRLYFAFGKGHGEMGHVLPGLIHIAESRNRA
jgi:L-ribulokinase